MNVRHRARKAFTLVEVLIVVIVLSLGACGPRVRGPLKLVEMDSGCMVELRIGDEVEVVLEGNPSTGYLWEVASKDVTVVEQQGEAQFKADSDAPGSGGKVTLCFEAVAPGEELLQLVYHRPFETGVAPLNTFEMHVL